LVGWLEQHPGHPGRVPRPRWRLCQRGNTRLLLGVGVSSSPYWRGAVAATHPFSGESVGCRGVESYFRSANSRAGTRARPRTELCLDDGSWNIHSAVVLPTQLARTNIQSSPALPHFGELAA
jgi:hypothetical protein